MVDIFDNAELDIIATDQSKVIVNLYGDAKVMSPIDPLNIILKVKNKATY